MISCKAIGLIAILFRLTHDRSGLPKKTETYFFFTINKDRVHDFRTQLTHLIPLITTTAQARSGRDKIVQHKVAPAGQKPLYVELSGVNIAFSHKGFVQVSRTSWSASQKARYVADF